MKAKQPYRYWTSTGYYEEGPGGIGISVATPDEERGFRRNIRQINANIGEATALKQLINAARDVAEHASEENLIKLRDAVENHNNGGMIHADGPRNIGGCHR